MNARKIIKNLMKEYGGTQKIFASMVGVSQPTVANWMNMDELPSTAVTKIMKALPDVSFDFLTGKNDVNVTTPRNKAHNSAALGVPFYSSMPVSAGQLPMGDPDLATQNISIPGVNAEAFFPVTGNSMNPTLQSGDIIGIRSLQSLERIRPNEIYLIFTTDNERMLKRIINIDEGELLTLHSDNPEYKPFTVIKEQIHAVFRIVCLIRSFE